MSEQEAPIVQEELPIKKYIQSIKSLFSFVKDFDFRRFFKGIFTFLSIVAAYLIIELTHQHSKYFQQITKLKLKQSKTIPLFFFILSLYLIFWNIIAKFLKNRALKPSSSSDEYEEIPETQEPVPATLPPLPNGQPYAHEVIEQSLNTTIYFLLLLLSVGSYAYFNQEKRSNLPQLVDMERLNLLGVWFLLGSLLNLLGKLFQKVTKISQFRVLGISLAFIVGILVLGLANGLNTFIFI